MCILADGCEINPALVASRSDFIIRGSFHGYCHIGEDLAPAPVRVLALFKTLV